jgi:hypothetical protein
MSNSLPIIRRASVDDVPALVELARQEHSLSANFAQTPFDEAVSTVNMREAIKSLASAVFVSEVDGVIGGLVAGISQRNLHNRYCTVYELLWFSVDGHGLRLLSELKRWAVKMRATRLVVHNYARMIDPNRFTKIMGKAGFDTLGMTYSMQLEK